MKERKIYWERTFGHCNTSIKLLGRKKKRNRKEEAEAETETEEKEDGKKWKRTRPEQLIFYSDQMLLTEHES